MREFFRGWRRKMGCVTLAMACVFMAGWLRSLSVTDQLTIRVGDHTLHWFISGENCIGWVIVHSADTFPARFRTGWDRTGFPIFSAVYSRWQVETELQDSKNRTFRIGGSFIGTTSPNQHIIIPYAVILTPLTLLSAFLLVSNTRRSTSKKIPEPTANEGA